MAQSEAGKGSRRRRCDERKVSSNWDKIFGKKKQTFSEFISRATPEEKTKVYERVIDKANEEQQQTLKD
ncbi:MAG: hypothetical protein COB36_10990 [Alphaproteobacteria bacterium]|nr:MAG: hypothetical protein COB36_10990 [Alphaproteobacteria bacterium]